MSDCAAQPVPCPKAPLCPLSRVRAGMMVRIKKLSAPDPTSRRLREIGFCEEQIVKLLASQANLICLVCNARLGLSRQLGDAILVEPL